MIPLRPMSVEEQCAYCGAESGPNGEPALIFTSERNEITGHYYTAVVDRNGAQIEMFTDPQETVDPTYGTFFLKAGYNTAAWIVSSLPDILTIQLLLDVGFRLEDVGFSLPHETPEDDLELTAPCGTLIPDHVVRPNLNDVAFFDSVLADAMQRSGKAHSIAKFVEDFFNAVCCPKYNPEPELAASEIDLRRFVGILEDFRRDGNSERAELFVREVKQRREKKSQQWSKWSKQRIDKNHAV